jgi:predicted metal-dependent phosphoesterase TrpH
MIDLHLHSVASDGSDPPSQIARLAFEAGLEAFALTDHDTFDGLPEASQRAETLGIQFVPGIELSCTTQFGSCHLLGYFVGKQDTPLAKKLAELRSWREERNKEIATKLRGLGVEVDYETVRQLAGGNIVGRPHFAQAIVAAGHASSEQEAFDRYLASGKPAYVPKARLSASQAIALVLESGGVPVLAHPFFGLESQTTDPRESTRMLKALLEELSAAGLVGLEAYYSTYSPETRQELLAMARNANLVPTGGSDYHGTHKPGLSVGTGTGDLQVPRSCLEELTARRPL